MITGYNRGAEDYYVHCYNISLPDQTPDQEPTQLESDDNPINDQCGGRELFATVCLIVTTPGLSACSKLSLNLPARLFTVADERG